MARKQPTSPPRAPTTNNPCGASRRYFAAGVYSERQILGVESIYVYRQLLSNICSTNAKPASSSWGRGSAGCPKRAPSTTATPWEATLSARLGARFY